MTAYLPNLPQFSQIELNVLQQQIEQLINQLTTQLSQLKTGSLTDEDVLAEIRSFDHTEIQLQQQWGILSHLLSINNTEVVRDIHQQVLVKLTQFYTEAGQNQTFYRYYQQIHDSDLFQQLKQAEKSAIQLAIRDFKLSGVALEGDDKKRYAEIAARLSQLSTDFSNHVLDATQQFVLPLTPTQIEGMPLAVVAQLKQQGQLRDVDQPVATLDGPSYIAIMTYAKDRELRQTIYQAYGVRASELANAPELDNSQVMCEILALRLEKAQLLGFKSYTDYSLAKKMAPDLATVESLLLNLAEKAKAPAQKELAAIQMLATELDGIDQLEPWDISYYSEHLKQRQFSLSQEELKAYFPVEHVVQGMFDIAQRLYGISIDEKSADVWHPDVKYYEISEQGNVISGFYTDLFARANKRGGAWMNGFRSRSVMPNLTQLPIAFLICNFAPAVAPKPALLTHNEIVTLFHEFGHCLHHLLTEVEHPAVAGVNGVAWDFVELPSQFMEFWAWQSEAISMISQHVDDQTALPPEILQSLLEARLFNTNLQTLRQVEFALFDLYLHQKTMSMAASDIQQLLNQVRDKVAVTPLSADNRFQHSFSHIFSGSYAAGYYSYKWAELLASDAFDRFEQEGIFNAETGDAFRKHILANGAQLPALEIFQQFRGREPSIEPLLRHNGW